MIKLNNLSKPSSIPSLQFGLPAGEKTCPRDCSLWNICYEKKQRFTFQNVKDSLQRSLDETEKQGFGMRMIDALDRKKRNVVRVHHSGDFKSKEYLQDWLFIALMQPNKQFYAYTKRVDWVKELKIVPNNFTFIFSVGRKSTDHLIDFENDRHARVFKSKKLLDAAGYVDASHDDSLAWASPRKRIGLVVH